MKLREGNGEKMRDNKKEAKDCDRTQKDERKARGGKADRKKDDVT